MSYKTPTFVGVVLSAFKVLSNQSRRLIGKYELLCRRFHEEMSDHDFETDTVTDKKI